MKWLIHLDGGWENCLVTADEGEARFYKAMGYGVTPLDC